MIRFIERCKLICSRGWNRFCVRMCLLVGMFNCELFMQYVRHCRHCCCFGWVHYTFNWYFSYCINCECRWNVRCVQSGTKTFFHSSFCFSCTFIKIERKYAPANHSYWWITANESILFVGWRRSKMTFTTKKFNTFYGCFTIEWAQKAEKKWMVNTPCTNTYNQ